MVNFKMKDKPEGIGTIQWLMIKLALSRMGVPTNMLTKIWAFLDGKKTVFGTVLTALGVALMYLAPVLTFFGLDVAHVTTVVGVVTAVVGVLHKIYKFLYKEEHP